MKVIYFHQYFTTPKGSAGTRSYFFAKKLVESGHKVQMFCLSDFRCNTGLNNPFKRNFRKGYCEGIEVIEFNYNYSNNLNLKKRLIIFLKYSIAALNFALRSDADLIFCTSTPLSVSLPGIFCRWIKGTPFVFEVRDLWPDLPIAMGLKLNPITLNILKIFEKISYKSADELIGLAPGICSAILSNNIDEKKINNIPNCCDLDLFFPSENYLKEDFEIIKSITQDKESKQFIAVYAGAHGLANGLNSLLDVAVELKKLGNKNIQIVLIGEGSQKLRLMERAKKEDLYNCHFLNSMPKLQLAEILRRNVNVGLMILEDIPAFQYGTSPNKFFDYLSSGLPVITNYPGWVAELVEDRHIGINVKPKDPKTFAETLIFMSKNDQLLKKFSKNARLLGISDFSRDLQNMKFKNLIERVFQENKKRRKNYFFKLVYILFKNIADRIFAILFLGILSLVLLFIALLVKINLGKPIFFVQKRPGKNGKPFFLIKFRSMANKNDEDGNLMEDSKRLNNFGKWLRSTSLDELPTLINIARGQMSFVGPRPLLMEYLPLYSYEQNKRHQVLPGLTGLAQVSGRNEITWERRLKLDVWYVENKCFRLDLYILFKTLFKVIKREGISYKGQETMPFFKGQVR